jgi:hypothetical protein
MNRDLVNRLSDYDFKQIIESSFSINEVAKKIGFKHLPGSNSKNKIKERMFKLNLSLREKQEKLIFEKEETNFENSRSVGNVGESNFILEASKLNLAISKPIFDDLPYDFIVQTKYGLKKVQVKTSEFLDKDKSKVTFNLTKGVAYKKGVRLKGNYLKEDLDYFYLYCIEINESYFIENKEISEITIRIKETANKQDKGVNHSKDLLFSKVIKDLI